MEHAVPYGSDPANIPLSSAAARRIPDLRWLSFGGPAAIVTSMGLMVGLDAATTKATVIASLLVIAIADNLTDSLSVPIYQEAERLAARQAFRTTVANFFARLLTTASFILLFLLTPAPDSIWVCVAWGLVLLSGLSYLLAEARGADPLAEIGKHVGVAFAVIAVSKAIGLGIQAIAGAS